jgi:hypothetical protein
LSTIVRPSRLLPLPLVLASRSRTAANVDSIGIVLRMRHRCSAGKSSKASNDSFALVAGLRPRSGVSGTEEHGERHPDRIERIDRIRAVDRNRAIEPSPEIVKSPAGVLMGHQFRPKVARLLS